MAAIYDLNRPNPLATPCDEESCKPPLVKILTSHEFSQLTHIAPEARAELAALELAAANFVELYPSYIIGSFSVPDKSDPTGDPDPCRSTWKPTTSSSSTTATSRRRPWTKWPPRASSRSPPPRIPCMPS